MARNRVIDNSRICPGLAIVGLSSSGQASYESFENSGIGSNGLTSARHELLSKHYFEKYPETCDPNTSQEYIYCGPYRMMDRFPAQILVSDKHCLAPPAPTYQWPKPLPMNLGIG